MKTWVPWIVAGVAVSLLVTVVYAEKGALCEVFGGKKQKRTCASGAAP